jgi:hypothetical protein
MQGFELVEEFPRRLGPARLHVLQSLADTLLRMSFGGYIEQALIRLSILHDGCCPTIYRQYEWALALRSCRAWVIVTVVTKDCSYIPLQV